MQELKLIAHTSGLSVCVATILAFWGSSLILLTWKNIQQRPLEREKKKILKIFIFHHFQTSNQTATTIQRKQYKYSRLRNHMKTWKNAWRDQPIIWIHYSLYFQMLHTAMFEKFHSHTSPGCMIVLYFFTNGERASSLNWKYNNNIWWYID